MALAHALNHALKEPSLLAEDDLIGSVGGNGVLVIVRRQLHRAHHVLD